MLRCCAISALVLGSLASVADAQPQPKEPPKSPIRLLPNYVATDQPKDVPRRTEPRPGPVPAPLPTPAATMQHWEHLLIAADHLEAAGLQKEADELRGRARRQTNAERLSSDELRRELNRLRGELEGLQKQLSPLQQIDIRLTFIEFVEERLAAAGVELPSPLTAASVQSGVVEDPAALMRRIEDLRNQRLIKILAQPALITTNGRPVSIVAGGEFPVPVSHGEARKVEWRQFGVRVEALATLLSDRRLRLQIQPEIAERDFNRTVTVDGKEVPGLTTRRLNTQVELNAGEMLVLSGLRSTRSNVEPDGTDRIETGQLVVLVTADLIELPSPSINPDERPLAPRPPAPLPLDR